MGPEFFQTMMGRKFYEADVPRIAVALERIADALEKQNALAEASKSPDSLKTLVGPFMASSGGEKMQMVDVDQEILEAGKPLTKAEVDNGVGDILRMLKNSGSKGVLEITDIEAMNFLRRARIRLELSKHYVMVNVSPDGGKMTVERVK